MMIEDAREFLKNLAADGLDAYLNRVWEMRYPEPPKSSSEGWPYKPSKLAKPEPVPARKHLQVLK